MMDFDSLKESLYKELAGCRGRASLSLEIEGSTYELNNHQRYQSASLIKLPIFFEALRQIDEKLISPQQKISIDNNNKIGDTGILQALKNIEALSIIDLLTLMIIVSDNSATNILIDKIGMEAINKTMLTIGMKHTVLQRKMLDFQSMKAGRDNYTTASDVICCLREATTGNLLSQKSREVFVSVLQQQQFREKLPAYIDYSQATVGNKTGELPGVEHDSAVIHYANKIAYAAILIDQLPDAESGKSTIRKAGKLLNSFISGLST